MTFCRSECRFLTKWQFSDDPAEICPVCFRRSLRLLLVVFVRRISRHVAPVRAELFIDYESQSRAE